MRKIKFAARYAQSCRTALLGAAVALAPLGLCAAVLPPAPAFAAAAPAEPALPPAAEAENDAEKSWLLSFIEAKLSAPNRRISLSNIDGALSSHAAIGLITIADNDGVWLRIRNVKLDWSRLALLRGSLSVQNLSADTIEFLRAPLPNPQKLPIEAGGGFSFALPQLPLAIDAASVKVRQLLLGKSLLGQAAALSFDGRLKLDGKVLDMDAGAKRLDGAGGDLRLTARYSGKSEDLDLNAQLDEPQNGLLANILAVEGRPALHFSAVGGGQAGAWNVRLKASAAERSLLNGLLNISPAAAGNAAAAGGAAGGIAETGGADMTGKSGDARVFNFVASGPIAVLAPPVYRPFFGAKTSLNLHGALKQAGGVRIDKLLLSGDAVYLDAAAETAADGFLRQLRLRAQIGHGAARFAAAKSGAAAPALPANAQNLTVLPLAGGQTKLGALQLNIDYGDAAAIGRWSGQMRLADLQTATAQIAAAQLDIGGAAENLDNSQARFISAQARGKVSGMRTRPAGQDLSQGRAAPPLALTAEGDWQGSQAIQLKTLNINGGGLALIGSGAIAGGQFDGSARLVSEDISAVAQAFGQKLAGSVNLSAAGKAALSGGAFDLDFSGGFGRLQTDNAAVNALIRSAVAVSGGLKRDASGLAARDLRLANGQFQLFANGDLRRDGAHLDLSAALADLALLQPFLKLPSREDGKPLMSGAASLRFAARGADSIIAIAGRAGLLSGVWNSRAARDIELSFNGILDNTSPFASARRASVRGAGQIGGDDLYLAAEGSETARGLRLDRLRLSYGATELNGFLQNAAGAEQAGGKSAMPLWNGRFKLKTANLAPLAELAFMRGQGSADMEIGLEAIAQQQNIAFNGAANGLVLAQRAAGGKGFAPLVAVRHLTMRGQAQNIFVLPRIDGAVDGQDLRLSARGIKKFSLSSVADGAASKLNLQAELDNGAQMTAAGALAPLSAAENSGGDNAASAGPAGADDWQLALQSLNISNLPVSILAAAAQASAPKGKLKNGAKPALAGASQDQEKLGLRLDSGTRFVFNHLTLRQIDDLRLSFSRAGKIFGSAQLSGRLDADRDLSAQFTNLPLVLADIVRSDLGLSGALSGNARLRGTNAAPQADFDLSLKNASAAALRAAGLSPLNLTAQGQMDKKLLTVNALASGSGAAEKLQLAVRGQADLAAQKLDFTANAQNLPLNLAQEVLHNPALAAEHLSGALNAQAAVRGSFADPKVEFHAALAQLSAASLKAARIAPLNIQAAGAADKRAVQLENFTLQGPRNLQFAASGRLPFQGAGLDARAKGSLPLALANGFLAERGALADGLLTLDAQLGGSWAKPQMQGSFHLAQGQFIDAPSNLRLKPINISGRLSGNQVILEKLTANSYNGGGLSAAGAVSLDSAAGFPAQLKINLNRFGYNDAAMVAAQFDGALTISGPVLRGADIGGKITINNAEIRVPDSFGGAQALNIDNKRISRPIAQTQKRAGIQSGKEKRAEAAAAKTQAQAMPRLDIQISAPNQIFVRGRGLDAEMGGALRITGRADAIAPTGGFNLIRGRFDILAQRLVFRSGQISLAGNFNPDLNFAAVSSGSDVTVTITVSGTPKDLKITLSSDPRLPQDEILARLIFKRSLSELSPIQVAQLVDAAAEMSGVTSHSVFGGLRSATGLDQLDITTDDAGNAGLAAGRYIMQKLYLGVETAAGGASKGTVNLDITPRLKAKGAVGSDANSNIGMFYERDY